MSSRRLKILFSGMIAADPRQGGATWAVLQYVLGLRRLGHEVFFVEPVPAASVRPAGKALAESDNALYFRQVMSEFALEDSAAILMNGSHETVGLSYDQLHTMASSADVLLNVSGMLTDRSL